MLVCPLTVADAAGIARLSLHALFIRVIGKLVRLRRYSKNPILLSLDAADIERRARTIAYDWSSSRLL